MATLALKTCRESWTQNAPTALRAVAWGAKTTSACPFRSAPGSLWPTATPNLPAEQLRYSSHSPMGSSSPSTRQRVTLQTLRSMYKRNEPIAMITAHDFPSSHVADQSGMDMVLVGDSLAMVALGMENTAEITMEEMLLHCRSVSRGARTAFIVGRG